MPYLKFRNSLHISFRKIIVLCLLVVFSLEMNAQDERMNNPEHGAKKYYFGLTMGFNSSQYKVLQSKYFTQYDSIMSITPLWKPGLQVGIVGNLKLSNFVDVRTIPQFMIREKGLTFTFPTNDSSFTSSFESVLFNLPIEFKFKSDRQTNFRFYVCAGGKFDYDFNANANSKRTNDIIKIKPVDFGYNLGLGFEFFYPNFIFSPEIKLSNGLGNVLLRNVGEPTNKAIDKLSTRMIYISFYIQG
jgi:Outer membrane protein beta-barrel domain